MFSGVSSHLLGTKVSGQVQAADRHVDFPPDVLFHCFYFFIGEFWTKQSHWGDYCHFYTHEFLKIQSTNHHNFLCIWDTSQSLKGKQQNQTQRMGLVLYKTQNTAQPMAREGHGVHNCKILL